MQSHIETRTVTAAATESFNDVFSSTYENYRMVARLDRSTNNNISLRLRVGGADNSASNSYIVQKMRSAGGSLNGVTSTATDGQITHFAGSGVQSITSDFFSPFVAVPTNVYTNAAHVDAVQVCSLRHTVSDSFDGFTLISVTDGTMTGTVSIYGYAKA